MIKSKTKVSALFLVALTMSLLFVLCFAPGLTFQKRATAATSSNLNFQARLMNATGSIVPDGNYNVEFKLYNALTSSGSSQGSCTGDAACLWTETRTTTNKVHVTNGYLTVNLGSVTAFPGTINWDQSLYISLNIGGTATSPTWDGEMAPRLQLTAVPYAFRAGQLVGTAGANSTTIGFGVPTGTNSINFPDASGTVCLQTSTNCGFAASSGSGSYIQNGVSVQSANMNIQNAGSTSADTATFKFSSGQTGDTLKVLSSSSAVVWEVQPTIVNQTVPLKLNPGTLTTFTTPVGSSVSTAINIPLFNPGAAGQILAFGLPSTAASTARGISVFDARTVAGIQPAIALFSPNESDAFGLSWNSSNTIASLETLTGNIALRPGGTNTQLYAVAGGDVGIGTNFQSPNYPLDVQGDVNTSTQYRVGGSTVVCTSAGCVPITNSASYIQNTTSLQASSNFNISGTGVAGTALQSILFDTASAVALNVGTTNATAINLNKATTITGNLGQSGGTVSLSATGTATYAATGAASFTSSGAITLTASAGSTWSTSTGNLTVQSTASSTTLTLQTGSSGTVALGDQNTGTINIGRGSNIARTINIGTAGTTTIQAISIGSTGSTSSVSLAGGSGSSAISLTTATNGSIAATTTGTGVITLSSATGVATKGTSLTAFQVQNASAVSTLTVDTTDSRVGVDTTAPTEALSIQGNLNVADSVSSPTKEFRLRTSGAALDLEGSGADIYYSSWTGAGFTGTQQNFLRGFIGTSANSYSDAGIFVGNAAPNANPMVLVLAEKTTASGSGDPATSNYNGAMYYNDSLGAFRCFEGGEWRYCVSSVQSNGFNGLVAAGTNSTTTYANYPATSGVTFTKAANSTKLVVSMTASFWVTAINTSVRVGVNVAGTDYDCSNFFFNNAAVHTQISCSVVITGVSSGSQTAQIRWKRNTGSTGTGTLQTDVNDWASIKVEETD